MVKRLQKELAAAEKKEAPIINWCILTADILSGGNAQTVPYHIDNPNVTDWILTGEADIPHVEHRNILLINRMPRAADKRLTHKLIQHTQSFTKAVLFLRLLMAKASDKEIQAAFKAVRQTTSTPNFLNLWHLTTPQAPLRQSPTQSPQQRRRRPGFDYVVVRDSDDQADDVLLDRAGRRTAAAAAATARRQ